MQELERAFELRAVFGGGRLYPDLLASDARLKDPLGRDGDAPALHEGRGAAGAARA